MNTFVKRRMLRRVNSIHATSVDHRLPAADAHSALSAIV